jgi:hypothetical protein
MQIRLAIAVSILMLPALPSEVAGQEQDGWPAFRPRYYKAVP